MSTPSAARPPLTSTEKNILKELVETLTNTETHFCCGGTIQLPSESKLSLLYKLGQDDRARSLEFPPAKPTNVQQLLDACVPSPHGRGKETVFDDSYRLAREMSQGNFALTTDIFNESGVLASIAALTSPRNSSNGIVVHLYKLNSYGTGGFFKPHRDTPKSDHHIGTLVVALPIPFKGGALRVSPEGKQVLFDWGEDNLSSDKIALPWAFLFSDVEHEVLPVISGTRVTLALPFYSDLKGALKNPDFFPLGGKLGVALTHSYALTSKGAAKSFASHLKGGDAALHRVLVALNIPTGLRAVYLPEDARYMQSWEKKRGIIDHTMPDDEYAPIAPDCESIYTSKQFTFYEGHHEWDEGETALVQKKYLARLEPEVIWARRPSQEAFSQNGYYISYGNQASLGSMYVAAALVLDLPAVGQPTRASG